MQKYLLIFLLSFVVLFHVETAAAAKVSCIAATRLDLAKSARRAKNLADFRNVVYQLSEAKLPEDEWIRVFNEFQFFNGTLNLTQYAKNLFDYKPRDPSSFDASILLGLSWSFRNFLKTHAGTTKNLLKQYDYLPRADVLQILDQASFKIPRPQSRELTPMEQNLIWETEDNVIRARPRSSIVIPVEVKKVSLDQVVIDQLNTDQLPGWIRDSFLQADGSVLFPINPFNTSKQVPFQNEPTFQTWDGRATASRTFYFKKGKKCLAAKLPTNYTHPSSGGGEDKADMRRSVVVSMERARHIENVERRMGKDPRLIVLREVMAIYDKGSGNGFTVRDITPLMDGHFYIPSLAVWSQFSNDPGWAAIAQRHDEMQAVAQALLFIRYSLVMRFPHKQNTLLQLKKDKSMGLAVVVRDMSDTEFIDLDKLKPGDQYSIPGPHNHETTYWGDAEFRQAYERTVLEEVGVQRTDPNFVEALKAYRMRLEEKHRGQK